MSNSNPIAMWDDGSYACRPCKESLIYFVSWYGERTQIVEVSSVLEIKNNALALQPRVSECFYSISTG